jgi:preprotein translocase subunit SecF
MLAVDVSFLAVGNVNISTSQSVGVIANYLSTIFITGSLIVSLLLARQTQKYGPESAEGAVSFQQSVVLCDANEHFRHSSCQI